ncbi:MAG: primosomal protein N' [Exilispira sp.]|jgi:primosomal protein N' (replication factor Y)|nr:primosomal protein N' [Exilispira sp.]
MFADIAINIPLDKTFEYRIPKEFNDRIKKYIRVKVDFNDKVELGLIINIKDEEKRDYHIKDILDLYDEDPILTEKEFELAKWISQRYFSSIGEALFLFIPKGLKELKKKKETVIPHPKIKASTLNDEQKIAFESILNSYEAISRNASSRKERQRKEMPTKFLLYGVTGSGKTEIYFQLIKKIVDDGKQVILLLPEIALTPQMISFFKDRLGQEIGLIHSKISNSEKLSIFKKVIRQQINIIIGPRSALFVPAFNLGCIIIDEEHDDSYKSQQKPRYDARFVAIARANLYDALCIFGSATPSIESWNAALRKELELLVLKKRYNNIPLPKVELLNLSKSNSYKDFYVTIELLEKIKLHLDRGKKVIIFLNRRGFNSFIQCSNCGQPIFCDECSIPMTYHKSTNLIQCHYCGKVKEIPIECPICHTKNLKFLGSGTEKIEDIIREYFNDKVIERFDADSVKIRSYEEILSDFKEGKIDILIGTQMITKGHHFPNVSLVCVINADILLNMPDFKANEKTFQILVQVAGRSGRVEQQGEVLIQTLRPDHYAIKSVINQDYEAFIEKELSIRKNLGYPPFMRILRILAKGIDEEKTSLTIKKTLFLIQKFVIDMNIKDKIIIIGPSNAPIEKIKKNYRFHIIIKSKILDYLLEIGKFLNNNLSLSEKKGIEIDIDPITLL